MCVCSSSGKHCALGGKDVRGGKFGFPYVGRAGVEEMHGRERERWWR